jgi:uncharacterized protein (DUF305 family)
MNKNIFAGGALVVALVGGGAAGYALHSTKSDSTTSTATAGTSISGVAAKASATAHNAQDVSFAQDMIEHHKQAVTMAGMAASRSTNSTVRALASTIEAAQSPEINKMTSWLTGWGASTTPTSSSGMNMSGMSSSSMATSGSSQVSGMMSDADMTQLGTLSGAAFDKQFLTMMTQHHDGAITMAQQELKSGQYGDALGLAASIVVTQQGQISQMQQLLQG